MITYTTLYQSNKAFVLYLFVFSIVWVQEEDLCRWSNETLLLQESGHTCAHTAREWVSLYTHTHTHTHTHNHSYILMILLCLCRHIHIYTEGSAASEGPRLPELLVPRDRCVFIIYMFLCSDTLIVVSQYGSVSVVSVVLGTDSRWQWSCRPITVEQANVIVFRCGQLFKMINYTLFKKIYYKIV